MSFRRLIYTSKGPYFFWKVLYLPKNEIYKILRNNKKKHGNSAKYIMDPIYNKKTGKKGYAIYLWRRLV